MRAISEFIDRGQDKTELTVRVGTLAAGSIVSLEGLIGMGHEPLSSIYGSAFAGGLLAILHSVTLLGGGYHRDDAQDMPPSNQASETSKITGS